MLSLLLRAGSVAASVALVAGSPCLPSWSADTCDLFSESMAYLDRIYDPIAGYVFAPSAATALRHDTRTSAWYAVGLLARNQGDDVSQALTIIKNIISAQVKDPDTQWSVAHPTIVMT